jgi:hypothetical protein
VQQQRSGQCQQQAARLRGRERRRHRSICAITAATATDTPL